MLRVLLFEALQKLLQSQTIPEGFQFEKYSYAGVDFLVSDLLDLLHFVTPYQIQVVFLKRVLYEMRVQVKELLISATDEEIG